MKIIKNSKILKKVRYEEKHFKAKILIRNSIFLIKFSKFNISSLIFINVTSFLLTKSPELA